MLTVALGLGSALLLGTADFLGGLASKKISSIRATAIVGTVGLIAMLALYPFAGGVWSTEAVVFGALSGFAGAGAIVLLYACLAIGPMSILSPLTAVVSAIVPMTVGLTRGEQLHPVGYVALGLALLAVILVGFVRDPAATKPSARALLMATASGVLIGLFLIFMDLTPPESNIVPLIVNRAANASLMFTLIAVIALAGIQRNRRMPTSTEHPDPSTMVVDTHSRRPWMSGLRLAVIAGLVDATANTVLLLSLRLGDLTVISVLSAMYSAGTIILAAIFLREKLTPTQIAGLVLALGAAALLALA